MNEDVTDNLFHCCAAWAYYEAMYEGKHKDSEYVRKRAYAYYEEEKRRENDNKS